MADDSDEPRVRRAGWMRTAVIVVVLLIAYPLSYGPIEVIECKGYVSEETGWKIDKIYYPLFRAAGILGALPVLEGYANFRLAITNTEMRVSLEAYSRE